MTQAPALPVDVFLGGSCNPTTWRADVAIPAFDAAGVTYYNPQVDDWSPELEAIEAEAKKASRTQLFVIDGQTRALASIVEAIENICDGVRVMLVVQDIEDGLTIDGQVITGRELKDLNRARAYVRGAAQRHHTPVYGSVDEAVQALVGRYGK